MAWAVLAVVSSSASCSTLVKPVVCAVTAPVYVLGQSANYGAAYSSDGRGVACAIVMVAAVGAAGGLVTGVISDVNMLTGNAPDPFRNIHDPFATNTSESTMR